LKNFTRAVGNGDKRVLCYGYRQLGFLGYQSVDAPEEGSSSSHNNPSINQISGEFWRALFQDLAD
jgi:hypothetical protein